MFTLALLFTNLVIAPTAKADVFSIDDPAAIETATRAYVAGQAPEKNLYPRPTNALSDALSQMAQTDWPFATGAEIVGAAGQLVVYGMRHSFEHAMRRDLSWAEVRAAKIKTPLNPDLAALLRSSTYPLINNGTEVYLELPRVLLDLEQIATRPSRSSLRGVTNDALEQIYRELGEIALTASRNAGRASAAHALEVVNQTMHWFEASASPTSALALSDLATAKSLLAEPAGNLLITKAKRTHWLDTVQACADMFKSKI